VIFVDTNVFFYARDDRAPQKQQQCIDWLGELASRQQGRANLQVVNEFTNVALRRMPHLPAKDIFSKADSIAIWGTSVLSLETVQTARSLCERTRYSWWDCLLLASALELGCSHFLSEDLQDGQRIEGMTIVDPFAHSAKEILSR
jgi:predicted nucleic acid-binding protein